MLAAELKGCCNDSLVNRCVIATAPCAVLDTASVKTVFDNSVAIITQSLNLARLGTINKEKLVVSPIVSEAQGSELRFIASAIHAAPKPLSILTTATPGEQLFSIPRSAAMPPKLAP